MLIEEGLALLLQPNPEPTQGYKLVADYGQNYDPRHGNGLNGPSRNRIMDFVRFIFAVEASEDKEAGT